MNQFGLDSEKIKLFQNFFSGFPEIEKVFIYGSRAKGTFRKTSDVDFALKFKTNSNKNIAKIRSEAEELPTLLEISFVDEDSIEEGGFKEEYEKTKQLFYPASGAMT